MQRGRVETWKGPPVETGARLHENAPISMRVHLQGGSPLAAQWACRWLCLPHTAVGIRASQQDAPLRGRPGQNRRSGQGSRGQYVHNAGSLELSLELSESTSEFILYYYVSVSWLEACRSWRIKVNDWRQIVPNAVGKHCSQFILTCFWDWSGLFQETIVNLFLYVILCSYF